MKNQNRYELDIKKINKKCTLDKGSLKLFMLNDTAVLPFKTGSIKGDLNKFDMIQSSVFKKVLTMPDYTIKDVNELLNDISNKVATINESEVQYIFRTIFLDEGELSRFHPKLFVYTDKAAKGIDNIAVYLINSMFESTAIEPLNDVMNSSANSILEELVLESIPYERGQQEYKSDNKSLIPKITEKFIEDFKFLCSEERLFVENISKLMKYYLFFYISQVILMLRSGYNYNGEIEPVYYFLDWEKISRSRVGYRRGWKMLKSKSENIFAYVNLIQILNTTTSEEFIGNFSDIRMAIENLKENQLNDLRTEIEQLSIAISRSYGIEKPVDLHIGVFDKHDYIDTLLDALLGAKEQGTAKRKSALDKYENNLVDVAKLGFTKARGSSGTALNITQEWLIFFTRLCIKKQDKIKLNSLWKDFESRGLFLDKYSKELVVEYFEKINIMEKKSDSGDAQYVRVL